jgi:hypothetical protein
MRALVFVREVGAIDNSAYRSLTQTDILAASGSLRRLKNANLLTARGSGNKTYYVVGPEMASSLQTAHAEGATFQPNLEGNAGSLEGSPQRRLAVADIPVTLRKAVLKIALSPRLTQAEARGIIWKEGDFVAAYNRIAQAIGWATTFIIMLPQPQRPERDEKARQMLLSDPEIAGFVRRSAQSRKTDPQAPPQ